MLCIDVCTYLILAETAQEVGGSENTVCLAIPVLDWELIESLTAAEAFELQSQQTRLLHTMSTHTP